MKPILEQIHAIGLIPVIKLEKAESAAPLAKALVNGGLPAAEVTFRTAAAADAIREMAKVFPEMLIGAGTVLTTAQADEAMQAGAKFIVSPGLNPEVVKHCIAKGYPIVPGVATPSEIEMALSLGLDVVKFFPAEPSGGMGMIKAMAAPYTTVKFMPTGGINPQNLSTYLDSPKVLACGGSWMVPSDLIDAGKFDEIETKVREAVQLMLGFELAHVGINCACENCASQAASRFESLFGFAKKEGNSSVFAGSFIEAMKSPYLGEKGHIAIRTNNLERAEHYLGAMGVKFKEDSRKFDAKGKACAIYLDEEIGGFAVHLVRK